MQQHFPIMDGNCILIFHSNVFVFSLCDILLQFCLWPSLSVAGVADVLCLSDYQFEFSYNIAESVLMHYA